MQGQLLFLGTGASLGVPIIGCDCDVCQSTNHLNKRLRPSALVTIEGKHLLIDSGPDYRTQALRYGIHSLDGVLMTHTHHDHTAGLDDLRIYLYRDQRSLPILASKESAEDLRRRYYYLFPPNPGKHRLLLQELPPEPQGNVHFQEIPISYVTFEQGGMPVNGFRVGNLAYLSDIRHFSPSIFTYLEGVEILIISALRFTPTELHFSIDEALDFIGKVNPVKGWLTHISHDLDHEKTDAYLPSHIKLAYDGLTIDFEV